VRLPLLRELAELSPDGVEGRVRVDDPGVREPGGPLHRSVRVRGHPDRGPGLLHRPQRRADTVEAAPGQVGVHLLAGPELLDDAEVLGEATHLLRARHGEGVVLHVPVAQAHAEHQPSSGDDVQAGEALRDVDRVVEGEQVDADPDPEVTRLGGEPAEVRQRLDVRERLAQVVLRREHRVPSAVPDGVHEPDLLVEGHHLVAADGLLVRHQETEPGGHGQPLGGLSGSTCTVSRRPC
jgi:hypothetical protein